MLFLFIVKFLCTENIKNTRFFRGVFHLSELVDSKNTSERQFATFNGQRLQDLLHISISFKELEANIQKLNNLPSDTEKF